MINCPTDLVDGKWTCPLCDWIYPLDSDQPPKRNCPKSPEGRAGRLIAILHAVTQGIESEPTWQMYLPRPLPDLERNIGICLDCEHYKDNTCTKRGIRRRCQWLKSLGCVGFRDCERWIK